MKNQLYSAGQSRKNIEMEKMGFEKVPLKSN